MGGRSEKSERSDGEDDRMSTITDLPPPLPPPLGVQATKVQDSVNYNIELIKGYVAELEQLKEDLLDYDELCQKNQLPPLDKEGNIIEDPSKTKGDEGPKMTLIERIAKALEPKCAGRLVESAEEVANKNARAVNAWM